MLEVSGVQQVITVDIHSPQTEGFFSIPVDCLTARFLFERQVTVGNPSSVIIGESYTNLMAKNTPKFFAYLPKICSIYLKRGGFVCKVKKMIVRKEKVFLKE